MEASMVGFVATKDIGPGFAGPGEIAAGGGDRVGFAWSGGMLGSGGGLGFGDATP